MNHSDEAFFRYLLNKQEEWRRKETECLSQEKKDEANLCKIRTNIYNIFEIVYTKLATQTNQENLCENKRRDMLQRKFQEHMKKMPENWKISYQKAKEFQDMERMVIEEQKLEVVTEIERVFRKIMMEEASEK